LLLFSNTHATQICHATFSLCVVQLPDHAQTLQSGATVGEGLFVFQHALCKVLDLVLCVLAVVKFSRPENVILLAFVSAVRNVLTASVVETDLTRVVVKLQHTLFGLDLEIVCKTRAACAPGCAVIADRAVFKLHDDGTGALAKHPGSTVARAGVCTGDRLAEEPQKQIDVVTAVAEQLTAAETVGHTPVTVKRIVKRPVCPRELFGPCGELDDLAVFAGINDLLELEHCGIVAPGVCAHQLESSLFALLDQIQALLLGVAKRLFHQDVFVVLGKEHAALIVQVVGKRDHDGVDIVDHVAVVGGNLRRKTYVTSDLLCGFACVIGKNVADGYDIHIIYVFDTLNVRCHHLAATDKSESELFHNSSFLPRVRHKNNFCVLTFVQRLFIMILYHKCRVLYLENTTQNLHNQVKFQGGEELEMPYMGTEMADALSVTGIYTVLHPDLVTKWPGTGEAHPFPEIFYLSRGRHWLRIDRVDYALTAGQMIIYAPDSFHEAGERRPENTEAGVLTFDVTSDFLLPLYNRVITLNEEQRKMLDAIIDEGAGCFHGREPGDDIQGMVLNDGVEEHTLWRLKKQIEFFLMDVYRTLIKEGDRPSGRAARWEEEFACAVQFLQLHLSEPLTLSEIAAGCSMSVSKLKLLFREKTGGGPINYLIELRIEKAKCLIREGRMDFTEIAETLGFTSLHYFSRLFKKVTGMTPSTYSRKS